MNIVSKFLSSIKNIIASGIILAVLFFIVFNFYILASALNVDLFFYVTLFLAVLTDGLFILVHMPRKHTTHDDLSFDSTKLTVVIACYNGEDVIEQTIKNALVHVPAKQIIVVSDASTDKTVEVASKMGVRVYYNVVNLNKAFTISSIVKHVRTPYVLILDDDTLIGETFIPTSLLDDGYSAVAFNVMPVKEDNVLIDLQRFEYRKSMQIGKSLRSGVGAIGNVSGAIGLFHTKDLVDQKSIHSGQFGGEDEQRTLLVHLYAEGKGIAYSDSTVLTYAPASFKNLFKQRAFSWSISTPELFTMYWRLLLSSQHHYLLKAEKAYSIYIYVTDPLRILFFWVLFTRPTHIFSAYVFYLVLSLLVWLKTKRADKLHIVLIFPIYSLFVSLARFLGHFYWYKVKFVYFFKKKHHKLVPDRKLFTEMLIVLAVNGLLWSTAIMHFNSDLNLLRHIQNHKIDEFDTDVFSYDETQAQAPVATNQTAPNISVSLGYQDNTKVVAFKLIESYIVQNPTKNIAERIRTLAETDLAANLPNYDPTQTSYSVPSSLIEITLNKVVHK